MKRPSGKPEGDGPVQPDPLEAPWFASPEIVQRTYRWDRIRGAGQGIAETCWQAFALLIAIRVFDADESLKQFIPAGLGIGFLLSPIALSAANRLKWPVARVISLLWVLVAVSLAGMALAPGIGAYVACVAFGQIAASQAIPMLTHIYTHNYPAHERGQRLSTTFLIASLFGIGFGYAGGELLDWKVDAYPLVLGAGCLAALISARSCLRIPSGPAHTLQAPNPLRNLLEAWRDRLFRAMLVAWMLMGLGNLMLIPLRVEYLANPAYGINASNAQISALLISTVLTFRLLSTKIWGLLFDRLNVVTLRITLNLVFTLSIVLFFFTDNLWVMGAGCALLGTAFGGGGILWTLYVTKIAPPDRVASYMSVHSFLTGFRMALAPFIGYAVMGISHPAAAAWLALLLIGCSTLIFLPLRKQIEAKAKTLDRPPQQRFSPASPA